MSRFVDVDAFKEWLLENSINEREVEESKQIGIWIDAFYSMQNEQSDCKDCIKHGGDWECDRVHCHKGDAISRTAAIDNLMEILDRPNHAEFLYTDEICGVLRNLPPVQPRKGKWIPIDSYSAFGGDGATWVAHGNPVAFYYCSECKEQAYAGEDGESLITEYCPNCGCRMEEGDSE